MRSSGPDFVLVFFLVLALVVVVVLSLVVFVSQKHKKKSSGTGTEITIRMPKILVQIPNGATLLHSRNPTLVYLPSFLHGNQCHDLISLCRPLFKRSTVQNVKDDTSPDRTSSSATLEKPEYRNLPWIQAIEKKAVDLLEISAAQLEPLQVVRYSPLQFYKPHWDYFPPEKACSRAALKRGGQRVFTIFVYLNSIPDSETSGYTVFPKLGIRVRPKAGDCIVFNNVSETGLEIPETLHGGEPPQTSTKYGLNVWSRESRFL